MLEQIKQMLVGGIESEKLIQDAASRFYETIEEKKKEHPVLEQMLFTYDTVKDYFQSASSPETLDWDEREAVMDMQDDLEYYLQEAFDRVEDDVKHELLHGKPASNVQADMKAHGIIVDQRLGQGRITEDEVEEFYLEAFQQFDFLRQRLTEHIESQNPKLLFEHGKAQLDAYRQANGLLMDAKEFNEYYAEHLDHERLMNLLSQKLYETIHFGQRYILEEPVEEEDETWEEPDADGKAEDYEASQKDAVLVPDGDLTPERYTFVYELMAEYTGRRVLPSENEFGDEAYWTTYGDDFAEILGLFMIAQLENTIRYFVSQKPVEYDTFAKLYHWDQEQRENPEVILTTCDKISYYLSDLQESLWNEFTESNLQPIYEKGQKLFQRKQS